ncbi:MAG: tRNA lysidine(34) synthetase TilS [Vampirovibrionales bacterium]
MFDLFKHLKKPSSTPASSHPQASETPHTKQISLDASHPVEATVGSPEKRVLEALYRMVYPLLQTQEKVSVVVAFSGGLDSSVLLHGLKALQEGVTYAKSPALQEAYRALNFPEHGIKGLHVVAAWCDHGWRGSPAPEFPRIHKTCTQGRIPLMVLPLDKTLPRTETKARSARYEALIRLTHQLQSDILMTAHHRRDQAETIMLRLLRGTGLFGLQGIQALRPMRNEEGLQVTLGRPLLAIDKEDLVHYQHSEGIYFFEDPSNQDTQHPRNWVRHKLLPFIQSEYPEIEHHLLRLTDHVKEDMTWLEELLHLHYVQLEQQSLKQLQHPKHTHLLSQLQATSSHPYLCLSLLTPLSQGLQKRLLQCWLSTYYAGEQPPLAEMEKLVRFLASYDTATNHPKYQLLSAKQASSASGTTPLYVRVLGDTLSVTSVCPSTSKTKVIIPDPAYCLPVSVPGTFFHETLKKNLIIRDISNNERKRFSVQTLKSKGFEVMVNLEWWMDIAKELPDHETHPWALTLRPRRTGDRFMPLGMPTTVSLKRYLINQKIPAHLRDTLPLLVAGDDQVLWIPGVALSDACRVDDKPTHVLKIIHADAPIPTHKKVRYQTLAELDASQNTLESESEESPMKRLPSLEDDLSEVEEDLLEKFS